MVYKKIKSGVKKVGSTLKKVGKGIQDYGRQSKAINKEAESKTKKSGSRVEDVKNHAKLASKMKKERGVTVKNSIKKRLKK